MQESLQGGSGQREEAERALTALQQLPGLVAVTIQVTHADTLYDVTIRKVAPDADPQVVVYRWDVDRLLVAANGTLLRDKRWLSGLQAHTIPQDAFLDALRALTPR